VVEPVFGQIKQARGFRQFLLRGSRSAGRVALICTATPPQAAHPRKDSLSGYSYNNARSRSYLDGLLGHHCLDAPKLSAMLVHTGEELSCSRTSARARRAADWMSPSC